MFLRVSFCRRASIVSLRLGFLTYEESRRFLRPYAFQRQMDFINWSRSGARPEFIPSNPSRTYRDEGWVSWPDWLGYELPAKNPKRSIPCENPKHALANAAKTALVDFISQRRPDMEFRPLPKTLKASHLFRLVSSSREGTSFNSSEEQDVWMPVQIRFSTAVGDDKRGVRHVLRRSAAEDVHVIVLDPKGGMLLGRADEIPKHCLPSEFLSPDEARSVVVDRLEQWWRVADKESAADILRSLRERSDRRGIFGGDALSNLQRTYLDPLGLSWKRSGEMDSPVNMFIGDYRIVGRTISLDPTGKKFSVTVHTDSRPFSESHDFDFVLVMLPIQENDDFSTLFLFPKSFLLERGILSTAFLPGISTFHVYPPFKESRKHITAVRKAEQAPYFVSSVSKFSDLLRRFRGEKWL